MSTAPSTAELPSTSAAPAGGAPVADGRGGSSAATVQTGRSTLLARVTEPATLMMIGALGAAFALLFRHWFVTQNSYSMTSGDWSHAYFVPAISLYLLWQHRTELARVKTEVFWPGLVAIAMGIWSYVYFIVGYPNHLGQGLSMILTLFGVVLLLLGPRVMAYAFLPIAYLGFAITIPEMIMNKVTWPLQALAAQGGWVGLNLFGVKCDVVGNTLYVFNTVTQETKPLNVAEACSGMRMLIAFLALGAAVSLVATKMWWKRVVLLGLAPPLALLLNIIRVMVLGAATLVNQNLSAGQAHTFIGTLLLIPGFFIYMGFVIALNKAVADPESKDKQAGPLPRAAAAGSPA